MALFLFAFCSISLFASYHWIPERYIHTTPQYGFFAIFFIAYFSLQKYWKWAALMLFVLAISLIGTISSLEFAKKTDLQNNTFKVALYNKLFYLHDHSELNDWIESELPDILVIQEANANTLEVAKTLNIYPHQISKLTEDPFGMIFLSKYPIIEESLHIMHAGPQDNFFFQALIKINDKEVSIYTAHTAPPVSHVYFAQRNREFIEISNTIQSDQNKNVIFLGDMNVTPYSPFFKEVQENTGLKNEHTTLLHLPTWSAFKNYLFQIPIDHILHKGDLHLIEKRRGPSMGSDHYPLIATFAIQ